MFIMYRWGERNKNLTNEGIKALSENLAKLQNLTSLELNLGL